MREPKAFDSAATLDQWARVSEIRQRLGRRGAEVRQTARRLGMLSNQLTAAEATRGEAVRELDADLANLARLEREIRHVFAWLPRSQADASSHKLTADESGVATMDFAPDPAMDRELVAKRQVDPAKPGFNELDARAQWLLDRHRWLSEAVAAKRARRLLVEMHRDRTERLRAAAKRHLSDVTAELLHLARREAQTVRSVLRTEEARATVMLPQADPGKPRLATSATLAMTSPGPVSGPAPALGAADGGQAGFAHLRRPSSVTLPPRMESSYRSGTTALGTVYAPAMSRNGRSAPTASVTEAVRLRRPSRPIVPAPGALLDPVFEAEGKRLVISMPANAGQQVAAPDNGRVAFSGPFGSYGLLLILEHERDYHTILWGFGELEVATNDAIRAGDVVGVMGSGGSSELRVEFRRNGRPVGALPWLAASSSKVRG